jgi:hypothetical protein
MPWHSEKVAGAASRGRKESSALNKRCLLYKLKAGEKKVLLWTEEFVVQAESRRTEKLRELVSGKVLGKQDESGEDDLRPRILVLSSASYRNIGNSNAEPSHVEGTVGI